MNKYILFLFFLLIGNYAEAQCLTSSLIINTGYNPISGTAIAGGANGATPVPDPHWILTAVSPGVASAIAGTPIAGLIEVVPGNSADIITPVGGAWITNPAADPGNWISCLNSNTYTDLGTGVPYNMTLGRPFKMCSADNITLSFYVASDNNISSANVDGTTALTLIGTGFGAYTFFTQTIALTAGTHTVNIVVNNQNTASASSNPTGLDVYGTIFSATGTNSLVSESYASCSTYACGSTCNTVSLPDSLHICELTSDSLRATVTGIDSIISVAWTPVTGLSSSTALHTLLTVGTTSGWYDITVQSITPYNLVYNGDFSLGNTGFTSTYTYSPPPSTTLIEGDYSVYTNPHGVHTGFTTMGDHTTGTGNMMIINGGGTPSSIWCETIPVTPNTNYDFSAWFADCSAVTTGADDPVLQFMVNGVLLGSPTTVSAPPGTWVNFSNTWNSGANTSATICIYDEVTVTSGNDFVIDDISFNQICVAKDSIYVDVAKVDTAYSRIDSTVCPATYPSITLTAPSGYISYLWNTGSTTTSIGGVPGTDYWVYARGNCALLIDSFNVLIKPTDTTYGHRDTTLCPASVPSIILTAPGGYTSYLWNTGSSATTISGVPGNDYWVYAGGSCVMFIDSFNILIKPTDTTYRHSDTIACASVLSVTLTAPAGYSPYLWSTGSSAGSISVTAAGAYWVDASSPCGMLIDTFNLSFKPLPVVNLGNDTGFCFGNYVGLTSVQPAGNTYLWSDGTTGDTMFVFATGTYWLQVSNGCVATDSINIIVNPLPVVNLGNDTIECQGIPLLLYSLPIYSGATYLWNTGATTDSITAFASGTYWLQVSNGGCLNADTINIIILYDTVTLHTRDTAVCKGAIVQVLTSGNPIENTYQWLPTTGIAASTLGSPTIIADTSAMYVMTAYFPGCPNIIDSFYLDVQPDPINVYIGGNRAVCKNDTLHLHASVSPAWYTHYTYTWSPSVFLDYSTLSDVVFTAGDSTEVILTVSTPAGCTGVDSAMVVVYPADFAYMDSLYNLCPHDSVQFQPLGGVSYLWHPAMYLSDSTSSAPWVKAITSQDYTMVATNQYGCKDTLNVQVNIRPGGVIYLGDSVTIYPGESYQISPQTNCTQFYWTPSSGLNDAYISNPIASPLVSTIYMVHGTTEFGCAAEDSLTINVSNETLLALPNAFTPGTGPNNVFKIIKKGLASLNYFRVYNRWGNLVFETSNIDEGWDGTYKGKDQPFDVYIYEVEAVTSIGTVFHQHGNVTLLR